MYVPIMLTSITSFLQIKTVNLLWHNSIKILKLKFTCFIADFLCLSHLSLYYSILTVSQRSHFMLDHSEMCDIRNMFYFLSCEQKYLNLITPTLQSVSPCYREASHLSRKSTCWKRLSTRFTILRQRAQQQQLCFAYFYWFFPY